MEEAEDGERVAGGDRDQVERGERVDPLGLRGAAMWRASAGVVVVAQTLRGQGEGTRRTSSAATASANRCCFDGTRKLPAGREIVWSSECVSMATLTAPGGDTERRGQVALLAPDAGFAVQQEERERHTLVVRPGQHDLLNIQRLDLLRERLGDNLDLDAERAQAVGDVGPAARDDVRLWPCAREDGDRRRRADGAGKGK